MPAATDIATRILEAILAQRLAPGTRLAEQKLAQLFDCSRTQVREALVQLAARGVVNVSARRGWSVVEPSLEEAREAFEARRVLELGMIRLLRRATPEAVTALKEHVAREQAALDGEDVAERSFLLGDFHVCLAGCIGNALLADTLRDFTARTTLIAMLYQTSHDARQSCADHGRIVSALEAGDTALAEQLMAEHLDQVQAGLRMQAGGPDPLARLRAALAPIRTARELTRRAPDESPPPTPDKTAGSTPLGEVP
jgi:DNA-binding GntR family transcriptional regulator